MGQALYQSQPTFRRVLDECQAVLQPYLPQPLLSALFPQTEAQADLLHQTAYTQPLLFALSYALAQLWQSWGVTPSAVLGHSAGEYVAACLAGVFSLEEGLVLMAQRGQLAQALPQQGEMAVVFASAEQVTSFLTPFRQQVAVAAINGEHNLVLSGERQALQTLLSQLQAQGIRTQPLAIANAFHSPLVEPMLDAFEQVASQVAYHSPTLPFVSTLTGSFLPPGEVPTASYWRRHLRQSVQFAPAMHNLFTQGYQVFLEVGPSPTLLSMARRTASRGFGLWLPSLRPGRDEWQQMLTSLAALYVHGVEIDWPAFDQDYPRRRCVLPSYPFQRQRYWVELTSPRPILPLLDPAAHPLLGQRLSLAGQETIFQAQLSAHSPSFLTHYLFQAAPVLPAAALVEMALAAAKTVRPTADPCLQDIVFHQPLRLPVLEDCTLQLVLSPTKPDLLTFQILTLAENLDADPAPTWHLLAAGLLGVAAPEPPASGFSLPALQARCITELPLSEFFTRLGQAGLEMGADWQCLSQIWHQENELLARLQLPPALLPATPYQLHPVLLQACLHLVATVGPAGQRPFLLVGLQHCQLYLPHQTELWAHLAWQPGEECLTGELSLLNQSGGLVASFSGLTWQPSDTPAADWFYDISWLPLTTTATLPQATPAQVARQLQPQLDQLAHSPDMKLLADLAPQVEALCTAYMLQAFRQLGWTMKLGQSVQVDSLAQQLGVAPSYYRLFARLLAILAEDGLLTPTPTGWQVSQLPPSVDPQVLAAALLAQPFDSDTEVALARRCGQHLAAVLRGQQDPLALLFPGGSLADLEQLYQNSLATQGFNRLVQAAVASLLAQRHPSQPLRILEIGGGTGGTTAYILPHLPAQQTFYLFSDISPLFIARARDKFAPFSFVSYQTLDIELAPAAQGFDHDPFDLIVAANVLHATADLRQSLDHIHGLLAPGGTLLLLESTGPQRFIDLTFGLTDGWWRFSDSDLRPHYPLLSAAAWLRLLPQVGFAQVASLSGHDDQGLLAQQALLLGQKAAAPTAAEAPAGWFIFADATGVGQQLAQQLAAEGAPGLLVRPGEAYQQVSPTEWVIDPAQPDHYRRLLTEHGPTPWRGFIYLWALDEPPPQTLTLETLQIGQARLGGGVLYLAQALLTAAPSPLPQLWLVSQGAQAVTDQPPPLALAQASLWGLGRVLSLEHPELPGGLVDLDPASSPAQAAAALLAHIRQTEGEDQVAFRQGQRLVARLKRSQPVPVTPRPWRTDGSYLITGGLGYIGLLLARRLAQQGVPHLVLLARTPLPPPALWPTLTADEPTFRKVEAIRAIEALGTSVQIQALDVSDASSLAALLARFGADWPPLRGVLHAAGALTPTFMADMTLPDLLAVLRAKVWGGWLLHHLTQHLALDCFVLFSSGTSVWGSKGLAHHAAANHFLDGLAHYRQALDLPALSVNWGWWAESNFDAAGASFLSQVGLQPMPPQQAFAALEQLLAVAVAQKTVAAVDWSVFKPIYQARRRRPFLSAIEASLPLPTSPASDSSPPLRHRLARLRFQEAEVLLQEHVQSEVRQVLGFDHQPQPDLHTGLFQLGMDSLMAVELKSRLEASLDLSLPATLTFDYPTIAALTAFLAQSVLPAPAPPFQSPSEPDQQTPLPHLPSEEVQALLERELADIDHLLGDFNHD